MAWHSLIEEDSHHPQSTVVHNTDLSRSHLAYGPVVPPAMGQSNASSYTGNYSQSPVNPASRSIPSPGAPNLGGTCMAPTWKGFIHTTRDALMILEACLQGQLSHIPRRPHDRERQSIISSGNIFVYEENASGIRRWTDGITWSPSRIMGNFLVYRELLDGHQPGEKKRASKKRKRGSEDLSSNPDTNAKTEEDRQLIGSLSLESYDFKPGGLAKKTLSVDFRGVKHHIISYYTVEDVKNGVYHRPVHDEYLRNIEPRQELMEAPGFKSPVEDRDDKIGGVLVSPTQMQPSQHMQLVNAGVPVVVNVPHSQGAPRGMSQHRSVPQHPAMPQHPPRMMYSSFPPPPMEQHLEHDAMYRSNQLHPVQQHLSHPISPTSHIQQRSPDAVRMAHPHDRQYSAVKTEKDMRSGIHSMASHPQSMIYMETAPPMNSHLGYGGSPLPPSTKYVEDVYHQHSVSQAELSPHSSMYMLPQTQSYSG